MTKKPPQAPSVVAASVPVVDHEADARRKRSAAVTVAIPPVASALSMVNEGRVQLARDLLVLLDDGGDVRTFLVTFIRAWEERRGG